jgi:hypothetical protein
MYFNSTVKTGLIEAVVHHSGLQPNLQQVTTMQTWTATMAVVIQHLSQNFQITFIIRYD